MPSPILAPSPQDTADGNAGPVFMWPYLGAAFVATTTSLGIAILFKQHSPFLFGILGSVSTVLVPAVLFLRRHPRPFYAAEGRWLVVGCSFSFWLYDTVLGFLIRGSITGREIATALVAVFVDLIIVWVIVAIVAIWAMRHYASAPNPPTLQRWNGLDWLSSG
jgi:hypothetical protein